VTPGEFLEQVCSPNVDEFIAEPTSLRRAWSAVIALFHFEDYLAEARGLGKLRKPLREEIDREFYNFPAVRDIANASKHFVLRNPGSRRGLSIVDVKIGSAAAFDDGSYFSDGTSFAEHDDVVRLEFRGELIDVVHLCKSCLSYLRTKV